MKEICGMNGRINTIMCCQQNKKHVANCQVNLDNVNNLNNNNNTWQGLTHKCLPAMFAKLKQKTIEESSPSRPQSSKSKNPDVRLTKEASSLFVNGFTSFQN